MVIQHNIPALNSHRNMGINSNNTAKNLEKLSSGFRINRAGDDAAGLAISEKMRGQIRGLAMAEQNTSNGISLIQTAEGGLNETHAILQRMRELAVQASNGTYQDSDRVQITEEFDALKSEIDRIASSTHYNQINLLNGTTGGRVGDPSALNANAAGMAVTGINTNSALLADTDGVGNVSYTIDIVERDGTTFIKFDNGDYAKLVNTPNPNDPSAQVEGNWDGDLLTFEDRNGFTVTMRFEDATGAHVTGVAGNFVARGIEVSYTIQADTVTPANAAIAPNSADVDIDNATFANANSQLIFQIGANGGLDQRVGLNVGDMSTVSLGGIGNGERIFDISIGTRDLANDAIEFIDMAINQVSSQRASLGALQNRLEHTLNNLGVTKENLTAAESTIRDVDMAKEMMEFTKNNILVQASQAMLAQANQLPSGVLSLLR